MKLLLEFEDVRFRTTAEEGGSKRWLICNAGGKQFFVQRPYGFESEYNDSYRRAVDESLIAEMEIMLEGLFLNALHDAPCGVIESKCPTGEIWRHHFDGRCGCTVPIRVRE